jgi:hypothetical protein
MSPTQIWLIGVLRVGGGAKAPPPLGSQAQLAAQASYPLAARGDALATQHSLDAWCSVTPLSLRVRSEDLLLEAAIFPDPGWCLAGAASVVAAARDPEHLADAPHRVAVGQTSH